ncbi:MAG: serine--tRNA ligase, partial [Actinobacteria bacterium]|nr:serine--tRNA ligase [Actinomycetota bacterium]
MIDLRQLRNDPDGVRELMSRRNKPELVDELDHALRLDVRLRDITAERDGIRAKVNEVSKNVGALRKSGDTTAAEKLMAESRELGDKEVSLAGEYEEVSAALRDVLLRLPNVPHPEVV